ncbi:hypothetical protein MVEN_00152600 [Mycena venus]|uniref:Uncharacterized protein n=1 Tax=Mycena venus TaxID=2733690 RepID=A0A8H6YWD1_9AGAR|nr:hypothetical protein MVEN_00152600 [Mycena venus]
MRRSSRLYMFPVFLLIFVEVSRAAFTLSLPDKLDTGTPVTVQWSRNNADPTSFGLMQRSLQGNQPILSVTPVDNAEGAASGTVSVLFNTPGQVLLAVIAQLSLSSGEKPNQLAAGKQLTVVPGSNTLNVPDTDTTTTTTSTSTRETTLPPKAPSNTSPATVSPIQIQTTSSLTHTDQSTSTTQTPTSTATRAGVGVSSLVAPSKSSDGASIFVPQSSTFSVSESPSISSALALPSSAETSRSPTQSATNTRKSGPNRSAVVALAVILPLLFLLLVLFCIIRRQRTSTRHRIDAFTAVWFRRSAARGTISSFGDVEAGWMAADRPVSEAVAELDITPGQGATTIQSPIARRQQKLQLMIERLSERNAALEREADSFASASALMHQPQFLDGLGLGPPPVYMESPESSTAPTSKLR